MVTFEPSSLRPFMCLSLCAIIFCVCMHVYVIVHLLLTACTNERTVRRTSRTQVENDLWFVYALFQVAISSTSTVHTHAHIMHLWIFCSLSSSVCKHSFVNDFILKSSHSSIFYRSSHTTQQAFMIHWRALVHSVHLRTRFTDQHVYRSVCRYIRYSRVLARYLSHKYITALMCLLSACLFVLVCLLLSGA